MLPNKNLFVIIPIGLALLAILLFCFLIKNSIPSGPVPFVEKAITLLDKNQASVGRPSRLKIPIIGVNAPVEPVDLTSEGAMGAPKNRNNVAWLQSGARPGEIGTAVLAGHYGWKNLEASAFDNLYKLRKGDKLYIEDEKRTVTTFIVNDIRDYDQNANAYDVFNSGDEKSHLNLITCEGIWDKVSESYSKRLVVFADKE